MYVPQLDFENSPSSTTSTPACTCSRTTSLTACCERRVVRGFVDGLADAPRDIEFSNRWWTNQAARVGRQDSLITPPHMWTPSYRF